MRSFPPNFTKYNPWGPRGPSSAFLTFYSTQSPKIMPSTSLAQYPELPMCIACQDFCTCFSFYLECVLLSFVTFDVCSLSALYCIYFCYFSYTLYYNNLFTYCFPLWDCFLDRSHGISIPLSCVWDIVNSAQMDICLVTKRTHECMNVWINVWMNEWMNETDGFGMDDLQFGKKVKEGKRKRK